MKLPVSPQVLLRLWAEAVAYSVCTLNRTLSHTRSVTPFEKYYGIKPNISHLRQFGCSCYVKIPDEKRRKWDPKGEKALFLGYDDTSTGYRVLTLNNLRVVISLDVVFIETESPAPLDQQHSSSLPVFPYAIQPPTVYEATNETQTDENGATTTGTGGQELENKEVIDNDSTADHDDHDYEPNLNENYPVDQDPPNVTNRRYPLRNRVPKVIQSMKAADTGSNSEHFEPTSFKKAMNCDEAHLWQASVQDEFDSHQKNGTWSLEPLPAGRQAIGTRWVFKVKPGHLTTPPRYKSRFVAKGYAQIKGIDYEETYSPVVRYDSLRVILSMCAVLDLEMSQLDIKTAFLYGLVKEDIYITQPEGFVTPGKEHLVCKLVKCIYGLKQAPRVWNVKFNDFILRFGFVRSKHDSCVYFRRREEEILILVIWVDDGLLCSNKKEAIADVLAFLSEHFEMRTLSTDRFVGMEIERDSKTRKIYISSSTFIEKILNRFNMADCKPRAIPADPHVRLSKEMSPSSEAEKMAMAEVPYQEAIGCLNYLTHVTRPDIAFAVNQVARYCQNPGPQHWAGVKNILAYLKATIHYGLCFGGSSGSSQFQLVGYVDSDFAGDLDSCRSTSGYLFCFNKGPIS
jgi:hypothetical protein